MISPTELAWDNSAWEERSTSSSFTSRCARICDAMPPAAQSAPPSAAAAAASAARGGEAAAASSRVAARRGLAPAAAAAAAEVLSAVVASAGSSDRSSARAAATDAGASPSTSSGATAPVQIASRSCCSPSGRSDASGRDEGEDAGEGGGELSAGGAAVKSDALRRVGARGREPGTQRANAPLENAAAAGASNSTATAVRSPPGIMAPQLIPPVPASC
jgi:hypothetical protein